MHSENETVTLGSKLPPLKVKLDDTPTPEIVAQAVEQLQNEGKKVSLKMSQADYNRLMCMPHEQRLAFAMQVLADKEQKLRVKSAHKTLQRTRRIKDKAAKRSKRRNRK